MKTKLNLNELRVQSFVTSLNSNKKAYARGMGTDACTVRNCVKSIEACIKTLDFDDCFVGYSTWGCGSC